ncbi:MAG TPA: hypothetical protein H9905_05380, partial [Candidatus Faecalibacterium intestinipullorum]|nr:hypothetical protein [Candidatus Faecalibacterium intestinipullorum]
HPGKWGIFQQVDFPLTGLDFCGVKVFSRQIQIQRKNLPGKLTGQGIGQPSERPRSPLKGGLTFPISEAGNPGRQHISPTLSTAKFLVRGFYHKYVNILFSFSKITENCKKGHDREVMSFSCLFVSDYRG